MRCVGNNIESVTYEIEGERSYFEIIDNTVTAEQHDNGKHVFNYTKSVTFDYDHQESIDDQRIVEIYIGFPKRGRKRTNWPLPAKTRSKRAGS